MKRKTHALSHCHDCDWEDGDYNTAGMSGYRHHQETGHEVYSEAGYTVVYNRRSKPKQPGNSVAIRE